MKRIIFLLTSILVLAACNSGTDKLFEPEAIASQTFQIRADEDVRLITMQGAIIEIPKGAIQTSGAFIDLEIKEAYHISQMIKAGLVTESNGQPLSSGGMIYINAVGENQTKVKITQGIKISIPSRELKDMQLFKGQPDADGNMNWVEPKPLAEETYSGIAAGKALFESKCTSCHAVNKDMTGPALAYIKQRRDEHYLYDATTNFPKLLKKGDMHGHRLAKCVFEQWNKSPMNLFPELKDEDIKNIYDYIESASNTSALPYISDDPTQEGFDSCDAYMYARDQVLMKQDSLIADNGKQLDEIRHRDTASINFKDTVPPPDSIPEIETLPMIQPVENEALYYKFTIESFGWYNVDLLLKPGDGMIESSLMVRIQYEYRERINVYLVIPTQRIFVAAGVRNGNYVFTDTDDGKIYLPQHAKAYILAMGDRKENILFTMTEFHVQDKNQFSLEPVVVSKEQFNRSISKLNFEQLSITVEDSKNAIDIKKSMIDLKAAELLKPKNVDCDCGLTASDTLRNEDYINY